MTFRTKQSFIRNKSWFFILTAQTSSNDYGMFPAFTLEAAWEVVCRNATFMRRLNRHLLRSPIGSRIFE